MHVCMYLCVYVCMYVCTHVCRSYNNNTFSDGVLHANELGWRPMVPQYGYRYNDWLPSFHLDAVDALCDECALGCLGLLLV